VIHLGLGSSRREIVGANVSCAQMLPPPCDQMYSRRIFAAVPLEMTLAIVRAMSELNSNGIGPPMLSSKLDYNSSRGPLRVYRRPPCAGFNSSHIGANDLSPSHRSL